MPAYALLSTLIYILIVGLFVGLVFYLIRFIPDADAQSIARTVMSIIVVVSVLYFLLGLVPAGGGLYLRH